MLLSEQLLAPDAESHAHALIDRLRAMLALHFDPRWGAPYWTARASTLPFNPRDATLGLEVLEAFGPMPLEELSRRPVEDFVPRRFHDTLHRFIAAETGGTTGTPRRTVYRDDEFHAAFVAPFVAAATAMQFPRRAHWLYVGPSGPHIVGKGARACAHALDSMDPFSIDFDPRWFRKLPVGSIARDRYLGHVLEQSMDILNSQSIGVIFTTPPVLRALGERMADAQRDAILGIHTGGIAAPPAFWRDISAWYPNAVVLSGYGNSLAGVCPQVSWQPGELPTYFPHGSRLHFRIANPDASGRGTVVFSRLDESMFLPNVVERDEAGQVALPEGRTGFAPWGLDDPRPPATLDAAQGLY